MALPLSLNGKYQLVVLGPEDEPQVSNHASRLDNALNRAFEVPPQLTVVTLPQR